VPTPSLTTLIHLLAEDPDAPWMDIRATSQRESGSDLLRQALMATADTMRSRYGDDPGDWRWGDHHALMVPHLTRSPALRALWRGPFPYPGFVNTVAPAGDRLATHAAAWRMVVDLSTVPPTAYGVLPGGSSGNPFSRFYAHEVDRYLSFELNPLSTPASPAELPPDRTLSVMRLLPTSHP
ncbi:MAG TPA: penicillin acylase family protein, partial [Rhodothermales bacterium]